MGSSHETRSEFCSLVKLIPNIINYYLYLGQELHVWKGFNFWFKSTEQSHIVGLSEKFVLHSLQNGQGIAEENLMRIVITLE